MYIMSIIAKASFGIFVVIMAIISYNPKFLHPLTNNVLGRLFILFIVSAFAYLSGAISTFSDIMGNNLQEGMEQQTILTKSAVKNMDTKTITPEHKLSDLKGEYEGNTNTNNLAADMVDMANTVRPINSNQLPIVKANDSGTETQAHSSEMLNPTNNGLTEGFTYSKYN